MISISKTALGLVVVGIVIILVAVLCTSPVGSPIKIRKTKTSSSTTTDAASANKSSLQDQSVHDTLRALESADQPARWLDTFLNQVIPGLKIPKDHLLICSAHCGFASYITAQIESLRKFCKVPYTFIVLNDVKEFEKPEASAEIKQVCAENGVFTFKFPESLHKTRTILFPESNDDGNNPSTRCSDGVQLFFKIFQQHGGMCMILDADCCPIKDFKPQDILAGKSYAATQQSRAGDGFVIDYLWHTIMVFDMSKFLKPEWMNADCGRVRDVAVDSVGQWYTYYEKTNRQNMPHFLSYECPSHDLTRIQELNPVMECFEDTFLHFHNASGWDPLTKERHAERARQWLEFIRSLIVL